MRCTLCIRRAQGFGYDDGFIKSHYCSKRCQDVHFILIKTAVLMTDFDAKETEAMVHAGRLGGEYLMSIGQCSMDKLNVEQWDTFIGCVIGGFCSKLVEIEETNANPPPRK